jgi:hypothetical protein
VPLLHQLQNLTANGKQGPVSEEMSQTMLTNKKQGKMRLRTPLTLSSQPRRALTGRNTFILILNQRSPCKFQKPAASLI